MLTPADIYADIESYPPLMQDEIKEKYVGQEVEWLVSFFSGSIHGGKARLMFHHASRRIGGVTGVVALAEYPWLKSLRVDEPTRVKGRIRQIDAMAIELDILGLSIPEPASV